MFRKIAELEKKNYFIKYGMYNLKRIYKHHRIGIFSYY